MSKQNIKIAMQYPPSLQPEQKELISLADLAGITAHPQVLRILIELLTLNAHPLALHSLLKEVCIKNRSQKDSNSSKSSSSSKSSRSIRSVSSTDKSAHKM